MPESSMLIPPAVIEPGKGVGNLRLGVTTLAEVQAAFDEQSEPEEFDDDLVELRYWQGAAPPEDEAKEDDLPWTCAICLFQKGVLLKWVLVGWKYPLRTPGGITRGSSRAEVLAEFGTDAHSTIGDDGSEVLQYWTQGIGFTIDQQGFVYAITIFPPDGAFGTRARVLEPFVGLGSLRLGEATAEDVLAVYGKETARQTDSLIAYSWDCVRGSDYLRPVRFEFQEGRLHEISIAGESLIQTPGGVRLGTREHELGWEFKWPPSVYGDRRIYESVGGLEVAVEDGRVVGLSLRLTYYFTGSWQDDPRAWDHDWDDPNRTNPPMEAPPATPDLLALLSALDWSGYFARAEPGFRERVQDEFLRGRWSSLFAEEGGRCIRADGEDLAEFGIPDVLHLAEPFLQTQGCAGLSVETIASGDSYAIRVNGRDFSIYTAEDLALQHHFWRQACERTADILNWQLAAAGSRERAFHVGGPDNPHNLLFLTFDQFMILRDTQAPIPRWQRPYRSDELEGWTRDFLYRRDERLP